MLSRMPAPSAEIRKNKRDTCPAWCLACPASAAAQATPLVPSARAKLKRETARTPTMSKSAPENSGKNEYCENSNKMSSRDAVIRSRKIALLPGTAGVPPALATQTPERERPQPQRPLRCHPGSERSLIAKRSSAAAIRDPGLTGTESNRLCAPKRLEVAETDIRPPRLIAFRRPRTSRQVFLGLQRFLGRLPRLIVIVPMAQFRLVETAAAEGLECHPRRSSKPHEIDESRPAPQGSKRAPRSDLNDHRQRSLPNG
jgi:hypothetical protein